MTITQEDVAISLCTRCNGSGEVFRSKPIPGGIERWNGACLECNGRTVMLTEVGARLFDFIREAMRYTPRHFAE